jgi:hypothetical protein
MKVIYKAKSRIIKIKFLVLTNFILSVLAEASCPKGQFKATLFTDGCSDCPEDPKTNCENEGADAASCEQACIESK